MRSRTCFNWYPIFIKFHVSPRRPSAAVAPHPPLQPRTPMSTPLRVCSPRGDRLRHTINRPRLVGSHAPESRSIQLAIVCSSVAMILSASSRSTSPVG